MARPTVSIERTPRGYELHVNGDFYGWHACNAAANRFRRLVTSGKPLDARTLALLAEARMEKAERDNRAAVKQITENVSAAVDA